MKKALLICCILLFNWTAFSQTVTFFGVVSNKEGQKVEDARITYGKEKKYTRSDAEGKFSFEIQIENLDKIVFTHPKYASKEVAYTAKKLKKERVELSIVLDYRVLKEVTVGVKTPQKFFGSPDFSVADFEIDGNGNMLLLTYEKSQKKKYELKLLNERQVVIDSYEITSGPIEIACDYQKNLRLLSDQNVYLVEIRDHKLGIRQEKKDDYIAYITPIVDTAKSNYYFTNYDERYPKFTYFQFNKADSTYMKIRDIIDEEMMEQYRAVYNFSCERARLWASNKEIETGVDKEIWLGAEIFTRSNYYTPLYAPLFVNNDTVIIFDHYKNFMFRYTNDLTYQDSLKIDYHTEVKKMIWNRSLIQDDVTNKIYAVFEMNGYTYLSLLNLSTGRIELSKKLFHQYIENIKVIDNNVYYIYRPYESIQKKSIYREKIKL